MDSLLLDPSRPMRAPLETDAVRQGSGIVRKHCLSPLPKPEERPGQLDVVERDLVAEGSREASMERRYFWRYRLLSNPGRGPGQLDDVERDSAAEKSWLDRLISDGHRPISDGHRPISDGHRPNPRRRHGRRDIGSSPPSETGSEALSSE